MPLYLIQSMNTAEQTVKNREYLRTVMWSQTTTALESYSSTEHCSLNLKIIF